MTSGYVTGLFIFIDRMFFLAPTSHDDADCPGDNTKVLSAPPPRGGESSKIQLANGSL